MSAAFIPVAADNDSPVQADRSFAEDTIEPGDEIEVEVEIKILEDVTELDMIDEVEPEVLEDGSNIDSFQFGWENMDPVAPEVEAAGVSGATVIWGDQDWEAGAVVTIPYTLNTSPDMEDGDELTFSSASEVDGEAYDIGGPDTVTVEEDDPEPDEPADFRLADLFPEDEEVVVGDDPITYEVWVQNIGDETGEQDLELTIGDDYSDTVTQELPGGADETVLFDDVPVGELEPGEHTVEVSSENDSVDTSLTVAEEPDAASFQLSNLEPANEEVIEGADPIDYTVDVENIGDLVGEQDIELEILDGDEAEFSDTIEALEVEAEDTEAVTFADVRVGDLDPASYTVQVSSANDTIDTSLTVEEEPEAASYQLSDLEPADEEVIEGADPIDYAVHVENVGEESGEQDIDLAIVYDGDAEYTATVEGVALDANENETVTFDDVPVADLDPATYSVEVSSENDSIDTSLTVSEEPDPANYQLSDLDPEELTVIQDVDDEPTDVSVTVDNIGDEPGEQTIELVVVNETDETVYTAQEENVVLDADESETIVFEDVPVDELDVGNYTHTVSSANDSVTGEITVIDEEPFLDDEVPGFGPLIAIIAVLLGAGIARRRL